MNFEPIFNEVIIVKESGIHNKGVFAKKNISKGSRIIEYTGEKISKEEGTLRLDESYLKHSMNPKENAATYIFELDDENDIDGDVDNNPAKYINHSCDPNCEVDISEGHIWIYALKDIKKGEELHYNYGHELNPKDMYDFKKHPCYCGSINCVGYMVAEEDWPKMKELIEKEKQIKNP